MLAEVGSIFLGLALAVVLYAACAAFFGLRQSDTRWAQSGRGRRGVPIGRGRPG
jgi:hypothetical protein